MRASILAVLALAVSAFGQGAPTICNGQASFCARSYSNVSYIGAHNSYAVGAGNLGANQNYTVLTQLNNGIRLLQVQGTMNQGSLHLCHTSCLLLDYGTFTSYLTVVKSWLDANPTEVITILMVNSDGIAPSVWAKSYVDSGLMADVYTPPSVPIAYNAWPTLGSMIQAKTRVVNFLAQNANAQSQLFLIDEFTNIWETPFDETDASFPCSVNRVTGSPAGKMYLVNHFLDVNITLLGANYPSPDRANLLTTNAVNGPTGLATQSSACQAQHGGQKPTFTLVDYYEMGNGSVFQYAAQLNNVPYVARMIGNGTTTTSGSAPRSSNSTTTSGSGSTSTSLSSAATLEIGSFLLGSALAAYTLIY